MEVGRMNFSTRLSRKLDSIKVLTLDAMDTIIRLKAPVGNVYAEFARRRGINCEGSALMQAFRPNFLRLSDERPCYGHRKEGFLSWWIDLVSSCFKDIGVKADDLDALSREIFYHFATTAPWELVDVEVRSELEKIRGAGIRVVIVSNFDSRLRLLLDAFGLASVIDEMFLSGEVGFEKPDARIFCLAAERSGITDFRHMLHVGDRASKDYEGARAIGARALLFKHCDSTLFDTAEPHSVPKEDIVSSFEEIYALVT